MKLLSFCVGDIFFPLQQATEDEVYVLSSVLWKLHAKLWLSVAFFFWCTFFIRRYF